MDLLVRYCSLLTYPDVEMEVDLTAVTVMEGGPAVTLCIEMSADEPNVTLEKEVIVTLSTIDGTGT